MMLLQVFSTLSVMQETDFTNLERVMGLIMSMAASLAHHEEEPSAVQQFLENHLILYNVLTVALLLVVGLFFYQRKEWRKKVMDHLMGCAIVVFLMGVGLYAVGFWHEGTENNILAALFRSVTASMEMFVSESELIEVHEVCKDNLLYMLLFSTVHFLAICISAAFIIHLMGLRFRSYVKMRFALKSQRDVYVFFDLSQESVNLAKDICRTREEQARRNYQIVFVKTPTEKSHLERFSFSHILNLSDGGNEIMGELIRMDALLTYSRKNVAIGMENADWKQSVALNSLRRYLLRSSGDRYFFCLSPDEDSNINTAVALSYRYSDAKKDHIYCRACHNSITEGLASQHLHFIDSAYLSVLELKKNVDYQPVSFVRPDTGKGVATKPFRALIIGFGATGWEVFRFLYEFSAFVGKDGEENPFYCDIIDPQARQLEGGFYLRCPALRPAGDHADGSQGQDTHSRITFHEGTLENLSEKVEDLIKELDYIVVCTDNEKENLSIGITLLDLAYKYRNGSDKLGIFVGINDNKEYTKAKEVAFYNTYGKMDRNKCEYDFHIIPFGAHKNLFTYKNIIADEMLEKAKDFYYEYRKTVGMLDEKEIYGCADDKETEWNNRWKCMQNKKEYTDNQKLYYKNELKQKESQDMGNAWHIQTKLRLMGAGNRLVHKDRAAYPEELRRESLLDCIQTVMQRLMEKLAEGREKGEPFTESYHFIQEQMAQYEKEKGIPAGEYGILFENLAKCEHLRWNAANRILGYRNCENACGNQKHYLQKTHACMVSNEELVRNDELRETIKYDYNTILVTLK